MARPERIEPNEILRGQKLFRPFLGLSDPISDPSLRKPRERVRTKTKTQQDSGLPPPSQRRPGSARDGR